jgi:hypothetical protein
MTFDKVIIAFPTFVSIIGEKWLRENPWCNEEYVSTRLKHFEQLEADLRNLKARIRLQELRAVYRLLLRDENFFWEILHEIHGIALVGRVSSSSPWQKRS